MQLVGDVPASSNILTTQAQADTIGKLTLDVANLREEVKQKSNKIASLNEQLLASK